MKFSDIKDLELELVAFDDIHKCIICKISGKFYELPVANLIDNKGGPISMVQECYIEKNSIKVFGPYCTVTYLPIDYILSICEPEYEYYRFKLPSSYKILNGCHNCQHCYVWSDIDCEKEYYCTLGCTNRPSSGAFNEPIKSSKELQDWDVWSANRRVEAFGSCDNYKF